uniref:Uncharacterized protein n=1 Tax=Plectus sambesii TaxID=2011161 RepID=A0A914X890_9BILA
MEVALLRIVTECGAKNEAIKTSAQEAYDLIVSQQINPLSEMHVLREKYLTTIELALDAKGSRLPQCGIEGLQLLLRDNQLHSLEGTRETAEQTLPMQALHTLHCMPDWNQEAEIQCHCLTLIVQLMCSSQWAVTLDAIKVALELCLATYGSTRQASVRQAVRASVTQILNTFCTVLYKEQAEDAADDDYKHVLNDVTELLSHCTQKLTIMTSGTDEAVIVIDAINTILSAQTLVVQKHQPFVALLWQELCPAIVKLLGDPTITASSRKAEADESAPVGQGQVASTDADQTIFDSPDIARAVYLLCGELLRLMAPMKEMHTALEALFHKALLFPKVEHRSEALKVFKKILSSPHRVVDILLTSLTADSQNESLTLWKILLDSIVECSCSDQLDVSVAAVQCVNGLLASLTTLCQNDSDIDFLPPDVVDRTNRNFKTLKSVDLPVFKYSSADECRKRLLLPQLSLENDSIGGESTAQTPVTDQPFVVEAAASPAATDNGGEEKEADMDSCMSSLAQRIGSVMDSNRVDLRQQFQYVQSALKKDEERSGPRSPDDDISVATARRFVRALLDRLPALMKMRCTIEVDEAIQLFASEFYKEFTEQQESAFQGKEGYEIRVLNADALYLTAYASVRFVLRIGREPEREADFGEDAFVAEVFGSGCIVFASETMVRFIYRGLLEHCTAENKITPSGILLDIIEDYDGLSFLQMSDVNKLEKAARNPNCTLHCSAAKKLSRRLLTASWDGLVVVLSNLAEAVRTDGGNKSLSFFVHNLLHKSSGRQRAQTALIVDGLSASLRGLHRLAHLCNTLNLRFRSGWIFGKLVEVSCPLDELRALSSAERRQVRAKKRVPSQQEKLRKWTLRRQDALSIEIVLNEAIDNGTH